MSKLENRQTDFNRTSKKRISAFRFRKRGIKNFIKGLKIHNKVLKTEKYEKKQGWLKEFIQSKPNNKEVTTWKFSQVMNG